MAALDVSSSLLNLTRFLSAAELVEGDRLSFREDDCIWTCSCGAVGAVLTFGCDVSFGLLDSATFGVVVLDIRVSGSVLCCSKVGDLTPDIGLFRGLSILDFTSLSSLVGDGG